MPPREEYIKILEGIWDRICLTNNGPLVQELERRLKSHLGVEDILYVTNGTMALQIAIKALGLNGEIITTPFSHVSTSSSIVWQGCKPVFVDIDPNTLNVNPNLIEAAITRKTSAIVATHVYGNPCDIDAIRSIAEIHGLKVIYDAAHCFGTTYKGRSVFEFGDISTTSFHATKVFHTVEGGAVFAKDKELVKRMRYMINFGHSGLGAFNGVGINGKSSEFHAAMGLCNLKYIGRILKNRKKQCELYNKLLKELPVKTIVLEKHSVWNHAYYPLIFESEEMTIIAKNELEKNDIYPRRYFYPSLTELEYVEPFTCDNCDFIAKRVLCLPLYNTLTKKDQEFVSNILVSGIL